MVHTGWIKSHVTADNSIRKPHSNILLAAEAPAAITIISSTTSRSISAVGRRPCTNPSGFPDTAGNLPMLTALLPSLTSFSEELADSRTSCASKNSDRDSVMEVLLSLDTWCTRAGDSSTESCFWERRAEQFSFSHLFCPGIRLHILYLKQNCFLIEPVQMASVINMHIQSGFPISPARQKPPPHMQHFTEPRTNP